MKSAAGLDLKQYAFLDQETVAGLNDIAERIAPLTFKEVTTTFNVPEPITHSIEGYKPIQVLDYIPRKNGKYADYADTLVVHGEFTAGIDANYIMHLVPLLASLATTRVVAFGSPARWGNPNNRLTLAQASDVAKNNFSRVVQPRLDYLKHNRPKLVHKAIHDGASLGGDVVTEVPIQAAEHDEFNHQVQAIVSEDGVTGHSRNLFNLGINFISVEKQWKDYMTQTDCPPFMNARKIAHSNNPLAFVSSLMRVSNLAIAMRLTKGGMKQSVDKALSLNPELVAVLLNFGDSELTKSKIMDEIRSDLQKKYPDRVRGETLTGISHAVNDQIFANAAIKLYGINLAGLGS